MLYNIKRSLPSNQKNHFAYNYHYFVEILINAPQHLRSITTNYEFPIWNRAKTKAIETEIQENDLLSRFLVDVYIKTLLICDLFTILAIEELPEEDAIAIMLAFPSVRSATDFAKAILGYKIVTDDGAIEVSEISDFLSRDDLDEPSLSAVNKLDMHLSLEL